MAFKFEKRFVIISLILGGIAAVAAGVLGGVNLLTRDTIAQNEVKAKENSLKKVFANAVAYSDENAVSDSLNGYVKSYWVAYADEAKSDVIGSIYYASGKNTYGEISMMIGIKEAGKVANFSIVSNTQTYASTLKENYIDPFLLEPTDENLNDVKCGATYGARLIKSMCESALDLYGKGVK